MRRARHIAALALLLFGLALGAFFIANARVPSAHASPSRYGPDEAKVSAAVQAAAWPQQQHIWCGVAAVAAVADFLGAGVSQSAVADAMSSQSEWGTPGPSGDSWGPGFPADIARDGGADPRAHAAALAQVTGARYHEADDYTGSWTATTHLIGDLLRAQEPIVAIVDHGAHSVLVAAVYATGDPYNLNDVTGLEVWDPGVNSVDTGIQAAQVEVVSRNSWLYGWSYWGGTYSANWSDGRMLDPDPAVGPYTYDPNSGRNQHLWIGHYVYIRPDAGGQATSGVSPDWAFNQNVALIRGYNGEVPAGYNGPSVALYTPPPPPPPTPTPKPTATPTPAPTWTPRGAVIDPTRPWEDETVTPSTPTVVEKPTPAANSPLSFSLQQVCIGSNCSPGAPWALGGGFLLAAALLALAAVFLLRVRRRQATPVPVSALVAAVMTPDAASAVAGIPEPAGIPVAVEESGEAVATEAGQAADAGEDAAENEAADVGERLADPLAQLAGAAARLDGLAEDMPEGAAPDAESPAAETGHEAEAEASPDRQDSTLAGLAAETPAEEAGQATPQADAISPVADDDAESAPVMVIPASESES